jgi:hypothetical protein
MIRFEQPMILAISQGLLPAFKSASILQRSFFVK